MISSFFIFLKFFSKFLQALTSFNQGEAVNRKYRVLGRGSILPSWQGELRMVRQDNSMAISTFSTFLTKLTRTIN